MTTLRIDLETYSSVDLKKCGVHRYAESDDFEVMLFGYAFDDEPAAVVDLARGEQLPARVLHALFDYRVTKAAYNAAFEIACLNKHFGPGSIDARQWRCTSVHALYLGLPGSLAEVGKVVGLSDDKAKLGSGWALIRYFCLPCKPTKANHGRTRNLPKHDPAKWDLFVEYCGRDVESEREVARRIAKFPVPDAEWSLWHLDHRMNTTGIQVNRVLVDNAIECDTRYRQRLLVEAERITGLANPNSRGQLIEWLRAESEDAAPVITDLTKKTVSNLLAGTDDAVIARVLTLRQELAKTSVSKYQAMARAACRDDRIRGLLQFYGANRTGRWAGRLVQVQNLPQNKLWDIDLARQLVLQGRFHELEILFGNVPDTLSQLIRTAFIATPGSRFIVVDFSAIEARVIAWLAWCQWRLDVFATHGKIYEASAEQMFKLPAGSVTKKSPYRQRGKVAELALGYQGGAGALKTMGALDMGLTEDELEPIKLAWRAANPEIVELWYECEAAAKMAVRAKTQVARRVGGDRANLTFTYESGFLFITLPSGRRLAYVKPRIEAEDLVRESSAGVAYTVARAGSLTYEGQDQKTKQWTRLPTYGGKLCIGQGSLVLARRGWAPIEYITSVDEVWDGVEWVSTDGAICNGTREVIQAYGAWMTPDHEVLGERGWIHASQSEGHQRAACRLPDGVELPRQRREEVAVAGGLRLRQADRYGCDRVEEAARARHHRLVRVPAGGHAQSETNRARDVEAPGVRGVAVHDRPLPVAFASSLAQLRRAGDRCVRAMAGIVRQLLGGHGPFVPAWAHAGPAEQRRELRAGQLPVGDIRRAGEQPSRIAPVYDLVNCGPRHRFVIWAGDAPLIVHNCENITQAIARDCLRESMLAIDAAGYTQLTTVHDEIVIEAPDGVGSLKEVEAIMGRPIHWAPDLPLRGDGFETPYYMKEIE